MSFQMSTSSIVCSHFIAPETKETRYIGEVKRNYLYYIYMVILSLN